MRTLVSLGIICTIFLPTVASGQSATMEAPLQSDPLSLTTATTEKTGSSTLEQPVSSPTGIQVSTSQDTATGTGKVSIPVSLQIFDLATGTLSVPITSGATAINYSTLDTMASGAYVGVALSGISVSKNFPNSPEQLATLNTIADKACAEMVEEYKREGKYDEKNPQECSLNNITALTNHQKILEDYEAAFFSGPVYLWGLTGKVGYQQYKYYEAATLAQELTEGVPWSVGGYVAYQPDVAANVLFDLSYQHQYGFKTPTSEIACPLGSTGGAGCVDGQIGPLGTQIKDLFTFDFRMKPFNFVAFDITPSYEADAKVWAINTPVYFMGNGTVPLSGGVVFGWRSDTHIATVGVFLSKPFSFGPS